MEFEEMKKIWDSQNNEPLYVVNEEAIHRSVKGKKNAAQRRINKVEWGLTIINSFCAILLFVGALNDTHYWNYFGSLVMLFTVVYVQIMRHRRIREEGTFDRSLLGELNHTIANTQSIVKFSFMMMVGYLIPMSVLYSAKLITTGGSLEKWLLIGGSYALALFLIIWERRRYHTPRLKKLQSLKTKLEEEVG